MPNRIFPSNFELLGPGGATSIGGEKLTVIAGPCALENESHSLMIAETVANITKKLGLNYIFKGSFDKDGRSSAESFHGVGLQEGAKILDSVRGQIGVPVTTDFSVPNHAEEIASHVDILQVPAYLCRQTSILSAAAATGRPVHLKKGQFMSPENLVNSALKLKKFGAENLILTDRGSFFGYGDLVNDFRGLKVMSEIGVAGFDGTHSIQQPTTSGLVSEGLRQFIPLLTRAAMASGASVLFLEVHNNPSQALGDPGTVLDLKYLEQVLVQAKHMREAFVELSTSQELNPEIP